jgi:hypothetical protein
MADERDSAEALGQAGGDCRFGNVSGIGQGGDITGSIFHRWRDVAAVG